jgi:hypothetical protein
MTILFSIVAQAASLPHRRLPICEPDIFPLRRLHGRLSVCTTWD